MMLSDIAVVPNWLEQLKFLIGFGTGLWAIYGGYTFVKNELTSTREGVDQVKKELANQTTAIVAATSENTHELRELRSDVKMMVQAMITPARPAHAARAARKKK